MRHWVRTCFAVVLAVGIMFASPAAAVEVEVTPFPQRAIIPPVMECEALTRADFTLVPEAPTVVESATIETAKDGRAEFCFVKGQVAPQVRFELRLPTKTYTGRYLQGGCGGNCGFIGTDLSPSCSTQRAYEGAFAIGFNDGGHSSSGALDAIWATNPGLREDFGHRGVHVAAVAAKAIIARYYGTPPEFSYFQGCSNGGREGLMEVQRYPDDFDGVIAGASNFLVAEKVERYIWEAVHGLTETGELVFTPEAASLLHSAVMEACDGLDGLVDGQIDDPRKCAYDPTALLCDPAKPRTPCLTAKQVDTAIKFYQGPRTPDGKGLFPGGAQYGTELTWGTSGAFANAGFRAARGFVRFMLPQEHAIPGFEPKDWVFDEAGLRRLQTAAETFDSKNPDISRFREAGGKLILWQGAADVAAGPSAIFEYYHAVRALSGGTEKAREFARLFLIPGMYHCRGGYLPYEFDLLGKIVAWVELEQAPDAVETAVKLPDGATRRRPVFAYPVAARYKGQGDINEASSFEGVWPETLPDDRFDWLGSIAKDLPPL